MNNVPKSTIVHITQSHFSYHHLRKNGEDKFFKDNEICNLIFTSYHYFSMISHSMII